MKTRDDLIKLIAGAIRLQLTYLSNENAQAVYHSEDVQDGGPVHQIAAQSGLSASTTLEVRVECYAGYRGEETPRRFSFDSRTVEVVEVLDAWLAPDHRYFKVRGDDGACYILRNDVPAGRWELTMFDRTAAIG